MRRTRYAALLAASGMALSGMAAPAGGDDGVPTGLLRGAQAQAFADGIRLKIAKNRRNVVPFGTVSPGRVGERVRLTLLRKTDGPFQRVARRTVETRAGAEPLEASFHGALRRPRWGTCRVRAIHWDRFGTRRVAVETFDCYMPTFEVGSAVLVPSGGGPRTTITAFLAETSEQRGYGLMYRRKLAPDRGMAFLFPGETQGGFWMKNTHIPLSIAFYDSIGEILRIMDMEPCEADPCRTYNPGVSYHGALEVNQGAFAGWGIVEGDRIEIRRS